MGGQGSGSALPSGAQKLTGTGVHCPTLERAVRLEEVPPGHLPGKERGGHHPWRHGARLGMGFDCSSPYGTGVDEPSLQKKPRVQSLHEVMPYSSWNWPMGQRSHVSFSGTLVYEPGKHLVGSLVPTAHEVPDGHMTHWSRELRNPSICKTVWLACVPPRHGCGALLPLRQRSATRVEMHAPQQELSALKGG